MKSFMKTASDLEARRHVTIGVLMRFIDNSCARNAAEAQRSNIEDFLGKFQLTESEIRALHESPIEPDHSTSSAEQLVGFFVALSRLNTAYADCNAMVQQRHFSAGFELLEVLGGHQERAYLRLFEWVKYKCDSSINAEGSDDIDGVLQIALKFLVDKPAYYSQVITATGAT
jgi:hypothetical protein